MVVLSRSTTFIKHPYIKMPERPSVVLPHALKLPIFDLLQHRRVILASQSPRRRDVLRKMGLAPEIVPSTFKEDLDKKEFRGRAAEYPVLTAQEKVSSLGRILMQCNLAS